MANLNGMELRVISDHMRCERGPLVRRTWKERLFSRPWRPLRAYNPGPLIQPKDVLIHQGVMFVTQYQMDALRKEMPPNRRAIITEGNGYCG